MQERHNTLMNLSKNVFVEEYKAQIHRPGLFRQQSDFRQALLDLDDLEH